MRDHESIRPNLSAGSWRELRELAAGLAAGETRAGQRCPFCGGGRSGEHSLSITRRSEAEALYCCHRASCGRSGRVACWGFRLASGAPDGAPPADHRLKPSVVYTGTVCSLEEQWTTYLVSKYGIHGEESTRAGWGQDVETGKLVVPLFDRRSIRSGTELRQYPIPPLAVGKKTRAYWGETTIRQSYWRGPGSNGRIVLVEDVISALKVSRHFTTVALHGTHLTHERLFDILEMGQEICIALDKDATTKAFRYQKAFGLYCQLLVAPLEVDLKYESDDRIKAIVSSAI